MERKCPPCRIILCIIAYHISHVKNSHPLWKLACSPEERIKWNFSALSAFSLFRWQQCGGLLHIRHHISPQSSSCGTTSAQPHKQALEGIRPWRCFERGAVIAAAPERKLDFLAKVRKMWVMWKRYSSSRCAHQLTQNTFVCWDGATESAWMRQLARLLLVSCSSNEQIKLFVRLLSAGVSFFGGRHFLRKEFSLNLHLSFAICTSGFTSHPLKSCGVA